MTLSAGAIAVICGVVSTALGLVYWLGRRQATASAVAASQKDIQQAQSAETKQVDELRTGLQQKLAELPNQDANQIANDLERMP